ncbi:IclR family transcriptional regulator [Amycolatopsis nigrescens]|uniref:IclR family transcriptional regulator n=1 Tax=Amycolatopsis nigrescens TaxID=381445 RepID=UPI00036965D2|nr:IclR family transcriptional regulator [Amycolatopsis nigrescens]
MSNNATDSVSNALRILVLLRDREPVRVSEVGEALGVARSTAHRLLSTLRLHGFVEQEPGGRRYRYGPTLVGLLRDAAGGQDLVRLARPHLDRLCAEVNETVNLLVLDGPEVLFVDGVEGRQPLRVAPRTGERVPAYAAAAGKVLLAELSADEVRSRYPAGLDRLTEATLPDVAALLEQLALVRSLGYGVNLDESVPGVHAVGVPIRDGHGEPFAAVTISGPSTRLTPRRTAELVPELRHTAACVSAALGYRPARTTGE